MNSAVHSSLALAITAIAFFGANSADAQVHRCLDASGKTSFSDAPCANTAKSATRVLGAEATDRRWENEVYGRERNMRSIENASRILAEPTSDARVGSQGPALMESDPNERIRAQDDRNMERRMAEIEADRAKREDRAARAEAARPAAPRGPAMLSSCDGGGCWDTSGNRYNRTGNGQNFWRTDGKFCRANPDNTMSCN